ncbi:MAG: peptidoglycan-binding protein [Alphaproteobacteria bacterium]|nr:peptidoglycan-binding protein [Alphaproteobacteria bacterium]
MRRSHSYLLIGLSVLALGACGSSDDKEHWGTLDDIVVNNRGVAPAKKVESKEQKLAEVKKQVNEAAQRDVEEVAKAEAKKLEEQVKQEAKEEITEVVMDEVGEEVVAVQEDVQEEIKEEMPDAMGTTEMVPPPEVRARMAAKEKAPVNSDLPMNAKPGECYAKVLIPAKVEGTEETVQISEEQKVLARIIPAKYEVQTERVLVREARQVWKPGRGPQEKVDQTTGEILCLVEEPAVYKTIEKRVLVEPERPEYKTIPAQYETITRTETIEAERLEWRRILCETNVTSAVIMSLQNALNKKGYDAGPVDGRYGYKTTTAVDRYQRENGLAMNGLTYETIDHLGIKLAGM